MQVTDVVKMVKPQALLGLSGAGQMLFQPSCRRLSMLRVHSLSRDTTGDSVHWFMTNPLFIGTHPAMLAHY
jgi:hypothetical protein